MNNPLYFSKLDSLRFIAFILVIWQHVFSNSFDTSYDNIFIDSLVFCNNVTGGLGVHIFFVLSGFLITFLMIIEEEKYGKLNLFYFYIRRFLRIWPLYYLIMILGIFVFPFFFNTFKFQGDIFKNLFFLNNFDMDKTNSNVGIAWSVAIEEQFYLIWPIIFKIFKNKKILLLVSLILLIFSTFFVVEFPLLSYFHTFGNIRFLMTGCIGALIFSLYKSKIQPLRIMRTNYIYFAILTLICLLYSSSFHYSIAFITNIFSPLIYIYIVIYLVVNSTVSIEKDKVGILAKCGVYTYGMYLYHTTIIVFVKIVFDKLELDYKNIHSINFIVAILSFLITIGVSYLSYEYFEKHILKFKNRFSLIKTRI